MNLRVLSAEFIGTFTLVTAVCGAALFSDPAGGGLVAFAFAVGLSVLAMGYAVGHISGGHFNPAVTLGLVAGGRFEISYAAAYIISQVAGGIAAALLFAIILNGKMSGLPETASFLAISNTFGSDGGYDLTSVFLIEFVITALFVLVIMGATSRDAQPQFAPIAIGLALVLFHLVAIPVSNASLNPARSTATAVVAGWEAIADLWLFWLAPIAGGMTGGFINRFLQEE